MTAGREAGSPGTARSPIELGLRALSALAVLAGGLRHLQVWDRDYRDLPDGVVPGLWVVKTGFPLNAAASVLVAVALVAVAFVGPVLVRRIVVPAALALQVGSIAVLVASRRDEVFGWSEKGYEGDPGQILAIEVAAVVLLVALAVVPTLLAHRSPK